VSGGAAALLEYGLFYLLLEVFSLWYLLANTVAYGVAFGFNFALNRFWTFNSSGGMTKQLAMLSVLLSFNLAATNALMFVLTDLVGMPALYAKVPVMVCVVMWNFALYKKVIYR